MDKSVIVSVRIPDAELRKLQLLAQIYQHSVGELIRVAVGKHVEELTRTNEFKTRALELKKRNEQTLNQLLEVSGPVPSDGSVVRSLTRNVSGSNLSKLSTIDSARANEVFASLLQVEVGPPPLGHTQIGAAASHKVPKTTSTQRWFKLTWKQGEHEWSMEGLSRGKSHEVVLSSTGGIQPNFITWNNSMTGDSDRFELTTSDDGRILIGILFSKALMRAETVRDTVDEAKRREMLPIVHIIKDAF